MHSIGIELAVGRNAQGTLSYAVELGHDDAVALSTAGFALVALVLGGVATTSEQIAAMVRRDYRALVVGWFRLVAPAARHPIAGERIGSIDKSRGAVTLVTTIAPSRHRKNSFQNSTNPKAAGPRCRPRLAHLERPAMVDF